MTAETEIIADGNVYFGFARHIGNIIQIQAFVKILILVVDGRGD